MKILLDRLYINKIPYLKLKGTTGMVEFHYRLELVFYYLLNHVTQGVAHNWNYWWCYKSSTYYFFILSYFFKTYIDLKPFKYYF